MKKLFKPKKVLEKIDKSAVKPLGKAAARAWSVMASFTWWWAWAAAAKWARAARKALKK